jgi:hypothetical protein
MGTIEWIEVRTSRPGRDYAVRASAERAGSGVLWGCPECSASVIVVSVYGRLQAVERCGCGVTVMVRVFDHAGNAAEWSGQVPPELLPLTLGLS